MPSKITLESNATSKGKQKKKWKKMVEQYRKKKTLMPSWPNWMV
jgi:hypothetical protein